MNVLLTKMLKLTSSLLLAMLLLTQQTLAAPAQLTLNNQEYFESQGFDVLVFSNWYNGLFDDSKISGVEVIHHGERRATNGDVRLNATPEQWDAIPVFIERKVDRAAGVIEAFAHYPKFNFSYSVRVQTLKTGVHISVNLPKPVPQALVGKAGFNLEFLPASYFEQAYLMDGAPGLFPLYPSGPKEQNNLQSPQTMARGHKLVLAPGNSDYQISIESKDAPLELFDGRSKAQNGWFVVRSLLPAEKQGKVLQWTLNANVQKNWLRKPVIGHSQLGYHPAQKKVAVIELDKRDTRKQSASLVRVMDNGTNKVVLKSRPKHWGRYKRYNYQEFDFSRISEPGIYHLQYGKTKTAPFIIDKQVFKKAWHPSLDVFLPVQMDHVLVNEAYRVWHGASHLDDALQAPVNHTHFDLYAQGPTTDTPYKPGEHIPGLNIGGWYDAGDYDIRTQTQYQTVLALVDAWETFRPQRDVTLVDYKKKAVDLHVPDGKVDILQQIEHGTLALIAQHRALGHAIPGIIVPKITEYTHLGDGLTTTDNQIYNPAMKAEESNGLESGKLDDRWAFTSESSKLNYGSIAALAAASRALKGHNDALAQECWQTAQQAWQKEKNREPVVFNHGNTTGGAIEIERFNAAVEMLISSNGKPEFLMVVQHSLIDIEKRFVFTAGKLLKALPYMDKSHQQKVRAMAQRYAETLRKNHQQNPYGVTITEGGWAGNGTIILTASGHYALHRAFPDLFNREDVFRAMNYLLGNHPYSDISFVSNLGAQSKKVAYGMNRADFSFISGGVVPGVLMVKPDFPENKENWPFFWGENEYVVNVGAYFIFLALAVQDLAEDA